MAREEEEEEEEEDVPPGGAGGARSQRWPGSVGDFVALLAPHAAKTVLEYNENLQASATPIDPEAILARSLAIAERCYADLLA